MEPLEQLKSIIANYTREEVSLSSTLKDLKIDSVDLAFIIVDVEDAMGIRFTDEDNLMEIKTVEDVLQLVKKKQS